MSHRCSGMNLTNMWEGSGSNNTLDCSDRKSFLSLIYDCVFEHKLLCIFPLNFRNNLIIEVHLLACYENFTISHTPEIFSAVMELIISITISITFPKSAQNNERFEHLPFMDN